MALVAIPQSSYLCTSYSHQEGENDHYLRARRQERATREEKTSTMELMNVFLRMWDGKTLCCTIDPSISNTTNIRILEKHVVTTYPNYNNNDFYFILGGKPLTLTTTTKTNSSNNNNKNNNNSSIINWKEGCTVFVQYRNKGGCFIISFTILCIIMTALVGSTCTCGASLLVVPVLLPFLFILPLFCL